MAIQKIGVIFFSCILLYGCGVPVTESTNLTTNSVDSILVDTTVNVTNETVDNCLENLGLQMTDSVFLCWGEIAINKKNLHEHSGNRRILITKDKKFYYSRNKGAIESLDNYFNTNLFLFKNLSDNNFTQLKDSLIQWNVLNLPLSMSNEKIRYKGGTETYFYLNLDENKSCTKFDMGVTERIKIEALLKEIQE